MTTPQKTITPRVIVQMLLFIIILPMLPLLVSWHWGWWEAWAFALTNILGFVISRALMARRHPDLVAERAKIAQQEDAKPWDKRLLFLMGVGWVLLALVAGLDELFGWTALFGLALRLLALLVLVAGQVLAGYALIENRFFSATVRIQTERGQTVCSSGPYAWMRHPGYAGGLLSYLAAPFLLDAAWAFLPALLIIVVMVIRTRREDQTLQAELPGYREYTQKVRYRLLPGIW